MNPIEATPELFENVDLSQEEQNQPSSNYMGRKVLKISSEESSPGLAETQPLMGNSGKLPYESIASESQNTALKVAAYTSLGFLGVSPSVFLVLLLLIVI